MDSTTIHAVRDLLDAERVLTVAVLVDGEPVAALLPFAVSTDYTSLLVQASGLARHTKGLQHGASIGLLVHRAVTNEMDPMQVPRLSVQAVILSSSRLLRACSLRGFRMQRRRLRWPTFVCASLCWDEAATWRDSRARST